MAATGSLPFEALTLGGRGSADALWPVVLSAVCGLPVVTRRSGEAASAGAAWLGARGIGTPIALDDLDPPVGTLEPDAELGRVLYALAPAGRPGGPGAQWARPRTGGAGPSGRRGRDGLNDPPSAASVSRWRRAWPDRTAGRRGASPGDRDGGHRHSRRGRSAWWLGCPRRRRSPPASGTGR